MDNFKALTQHLPRESEEKNKRPQSGWLVFGSRVEPGTSQVWSATYCTMTSGISSCSLHHGMQTDLII